MATYKVLQDIESEDKLIGPLTLRQCIYAAIAVLAGYIGFLFISKGVPFMAFTMLPFIGFGLFFAFPWTKHQTTEVWALAKIRFALKPRRRIWNQSGIKQLVTVTAPKKVVAAVGPSLSETEVRSRLRALADTIDSRGWAVKNVPANMYSNHSDRLVDVSNLPQEVPTISDEDSDDMFDLATNPLAQQFDAKMYATAAAKHQQLVQSVDNPGAAQTTPQAGQGNPQTAWYVSGPQTAAPAASPIAAVPTPSDYALAEEIKRKQELMHAQRNGINGKTIQPLAVQTTTSASAVQNDTGSVTTPVNPAILELANNNDLNVATIAREAQHRNPDASDEVVISLR